jgi:hypothetical protein
MIDSRLWSQRIFSLDRWSGCLSPILDRHHIVGEAFLRRCPFLALSVQQGAANGSKRRHKAKAAIRPILPAMARDPAACRTLPHSAANVAFSAC